LAPGLRRLLPALTLMAAGAAVAGGAVEQRPIIFSVPPGRSEALVRGSLSFPPGSLKSPVNLRLVESGREVPSAVTGKTLWFDRSVMLLKVEFKGTKDTERRVWAEWGDGISGRHPAALKVAGKPVDFKVFDAASDIQVQGNVNIGTLVVRVEKRAGIYYYWYLIPLALIIGFLSWRKYLLRRR